MKSLEATGVRRLMWVASGILGSALAACATTTSTTQSPPADQYRALLDSPVRTERDRGMDATRKPAELLAFAQVRPGMHVLDMVAGAGYTSQILALAVGPSGKVWAQAPKPGATLSERMTAHPQANLVVGRGRSTIRCRPRPLPWTW